MRVLDTINYERKIKRTHFYNTTIKMSSTQAKRPYPYTLKDRKLTSKNNFIYIFLFVRSEKLFYRTNIILI